MALKCGAIASYTSTTYCRSNRSNCPSWHAPPTSPLPSVAPPPPVPGPSCWAPPPPIPAGPSSEEPPPAATCMDAAACSAARRVGGKALAWLSHASGQLHAHGKPRTCRANCSTCVAGAGGRPAARGPPRPPGSHRIPHLTRCAHTLRKVSDTRLARGTNTASLCSPGAALQPGSLPRLLLPSSPAATQSPLRCGM